MPKMDLEGIVSKRKDSTYCSGRSPDWFKIITELDLHDRSGQTPFLSHSFQFALYWITSSIKAATRRMATTRGRPPCRLSPSAGTARLIEPCGARVVSQFDCGKGARCIRL